MQHDLLLHSPAAGAGAPELLLLFHGVGSRPQDLQPLGELLAGQRPQAWVVCVQAPHASGFGQGWQWFPVQGVTEADRPARVAGAMPAYVERVQAWQQRAGVGPEGTTLIGFSQGAIMSLESTQLPGQPALSRRVIGIAGRFAQPLRQAPGATVHLLHGEQDRVMPIGLSVEAQRQLQALGAKVTLDRFEGLGHGIDARVARAVLQHLDVT